MPPVPAPGQLMRNIHFFRADCGTDEFDEPIAFEPRRMLEHIDGLQFVPGERYFELDDTIYCVWVDKASAPARMRFAIVRREGLPFVEEGGQLAALNIADNAGLVDQIHVQFFPHNIVGFDFNSYGPRLPRLATYLKERGGPNHQEVVFEPLARRDVLDVLNGFDGIRIFDFRVRRADIDLVAEADATLADALRAQAKLSDADEFEVILRPKAYSRDVDLGERAFDMVRELVKHQGVVDVAQIFRVQGRIEGSPSEPLNVLDERLVSEQLIAKIPGRGRALDSASVYSAIRDAEKDLRDLLRSAVSIAGPRSTGRSNS